mmetsp:Transcript_74623/g.199780  ORF Transcript_74623/g.199780 Transcript_74623/m.199780 type:complete len:80 (-) Transcript_74623:1190-1429(-)
MKRDDSEARRLQVGTGARVEMVVVVVVVCVWKGSRRPPTSSPSNVDRCQGESSLLDGGRREFQDRGYSVNQGSYSRKST